MHLAERISRTEETGCGGRKVGVLMAWTCTLLSAHSRAHLIHICWHIHAALRGRDRNQTGVPVLRPANMFPPQGKSLMVAFANVLLLFSTRDSLI